MMQFHGGDKRPYHNLPQEGEGHLLLHGESASSQK